MALRRSNRRITITGSSVFSASTPMVPPVKENAGVKNGKTSPQWISGEAAFKDLKTPSKLPMNSRRTTITRQNIFNDETVIGGAAADTSGFMAPRFFIPVSPPGVKTRSRRSSMMMGPPQIAKPKKATKQTGAETKKVNSNGEKNDRKITRKTVSRRSEIMQTITDVTDQKPAATNVSSRRPVSKRAADGGDTEFTNIERFFSPIADVRPEVNMKKAKRSSIFESEETILSGEGIALMHDFQTPRTHISQDIQQRQTNNEKFKVSTTIKELKEQVLPRKSQSVEISPLLYSSNDLGGNVNTEGSLSKTEAATPKTPHHKSTHEKTTSKLKRQMSKEENEIEQVVKKMFSPPSEKSEKEKFISSDSGKAALSPARTAILKAGVNNGRKSLARAAQTKVSPKTPSRAAAKARKILGVSTSSVPFNDSTQNCAKESLENVERLDSVEAGLSPSKFDDVSYREENENNITLSHSSHSQWCTIL